MPNRATTTPAPCLACQHVQEALLQHRQHYFLEERVTRLAAALALDPDAPDPPLLSSDLCYPSASDVQASGPAGAGPAPHAGVAASTASNGAAGAAAAPSVAVRIIPTVGGSSAVQHAAHTRSSQPHSRMTAAAGGARAAAPLPVPSGRPAQAPVARPGCTVQLLLRDESGHPTRVLFTRPCNTSAADADAIMNGLSLPLVSRLRRLELYSACVHMTETAGAAGTARAYACGGHADHGCCRPDPPLLLPCHHAACQAQDSAETRRAMEVYLSTHVGEPPDIIEGCNRLHARLQVR